MEYMDYDEGVILVRRMPGDGHCLFSALVHQHFKSEVGSVEHYENVRNLRRRIVEHIRSNIENFRASLVDTVEEMSHLRHTSVEGKIEEFLRNIAESNEWGGQETIAPAATILNRRIDVYYENGPIIMFNRELAAFGVLRIAYRLATRNSRNALRNHYDSVTQRSSTGPLQETEEGQMRNQKTEN
ncbi:deubiquitinase OTUD6B-like [Wyeomyia smithii]|uniref:deubiquitinase OTUD6B-like n=1 Tax=Wyeomyia smithii TaxID=174621 RepID=UPI002467B39C|nr:deubiquitinase OTUD6B-like [Wyeomyia smithii]